jgi:hypothetical protein
MLKQVEIFVLSDLFSADYRIFWVAVLGLFAETVQERLRADVEFDHTISRWCQIPLTIQIRARYQFNDQTSATCSACLATDG